MNERIKELAEQNSENLSNVVRNDEWLQKFAELIVRECADIVNSLEQYEGRGNCSTAEYIKEHFGVE